MYKKGTGNDKQGTDAGNRTLCPYRNFSQAVKWYTVHSLLKREMQVELIRVYLEETSRPSHSLVKFCYAALALHETLELLNLNGHLSVHYPRPLMANR